MRNVMMCIGKYYTTRFKTCRTVVYFNSANCLSYSDTNGSLAETAYDYSQQ